MLRRLGFETSGKLYRVFETQTKGAKDFRVREFVIELEGSSRFPQFVQFQLTGDRCENLDGFKENDEVKVEFSLRGREWESPQGETRFFNSLNVWTIERTGEGGGGGSYDDGTPSSDGSPPPADEDLIPF
jgi:hypothetical protein